jgi:thioredoxin-dependent peroxiredoxin
MPSLRSLLNRVPSPLKRAVTDQLHPPLLPVGALSPTWSAHDAAGIRHSRGGAWQALIFYPADDTPGCTAQLQDIEQHLEALRAAGIHPFGVNPGSAESHTRFANKYEFSFPLLVDTGSALARPFGARMRGIGRTIRTVYLLDPDARVRLAERGAPPATQLIEMATGS